MFAELGCGRTASITGRYYAMDRDNRWDRVEQAYRLLTEGVAATAGRQRRRGPAGGLRAEENDEFVLPTSIRAEGQEAVTVADGDSVLFMNFRADRARQLTRAFVDAGFRQFPAPRRARTGGFRDDHRVRGRYRCQLRLSPEP